MKKQFKPAALLLAAIISTFSIISGCKKNTLPAESDNTLNAQIQNVKTWFEGLPTATATGQRGSSVSRNNMPPVTLQWSSARYFAGERAYLVPATIQPGSSQAAAYLVIAEDAQGNPEQASYTMVMPDKKKMSAAAINSINMVPGFLQGRQVPAVFEGALLQFSRGGAAYSGVNYANGQEKAGQASGLAAKRATENNATANRAPCTGERVCTDWYWQTWVDGNLVDEEYLFTTCVCDGDVGGGGMGDDEVNPLLTQFNNYVQSTSSPATFNAPNTVVGPDPITFFFKWTVTEGAIAPWYIYANGQMDYYHKHMYNLQLNATEHIYDIVGYQTLTTYYTGTNVGTTTTWTQLSAVDQVLNNNSLSAYGTTHVTGTIKHRANFTITLPILGTYTPESIDDADNSCKTYPR